MSNLKRIRENAGLSQSRLATLSGVSLPMIQKYEAGIRDINVAQAQTLFRLSIVLLCQMKDLLELDVWEIDNGKGDKLIVGALDFDSALTQARFFNPTMNGGKIIKNK